MMKLSQIITELQQLQTKHGDADFCIVATGPDDDYDEIRTVCGHDFVSINFYEDLKYGDWCCLTMETKPEIKGKS